MYTLRFLFLIVCLSGFSVLGQTSSIGYAIETSAGFSSNTTLPFWLSANQYGSVPESSYSLLNTSIFKPYNTPEALFDLSYKVNTTGFIAQENKLLVNELYLGVRYKNILLDLGAKNDAVLWNDLSSSNGSILKSINARAMPGVTIKTNNYVPLPFASSWLSVKANFAHYFMDDVRYVDNTNLHHKSLHLKSTLSPTLEVITGIDHYAQWGGTSPEYGPQPSSFKDYIKILFGAEGGGNATVNDQFNALGNHLGAYLLQVNYKGQKANYNFYYSHPFEDTSGREMANWQDGLYGVFVDFKKEKSIVSSLLLEFTYTRDMSASGYLSGGTVQNTISAGDNYFNNGIYKSGWTYHGNSIGSPYFTPKPEDEEGITRGVIVGDNRFAAFNIGANGYVKNLPYKVLLSHTTYYGYFNFENQAPREYDPYPVQFSGILDIQIPQKKFNLPFDIAASVAFDAGSYRPKNVGAFLSISKKGSF